MIINQDNFNTEVVEKLIFPELKFLNHISNKIEFFKMSSADTTDEYFCIKKENLKNKNNNEESVWIKKEDLVQLNTIIIDIDNVRKERRKKKKNTISKEDLLKSKERRFNKEFEKGGFSSEKRKSAYNYFVSNDKVTVKKIKSDQIKKFFDDENCHESKNKIKTLRKKIKVFVLNNKKFIFNDFSLKIKVKIKDPTIKTSIPRSLEILNLQNKEIKTILDRFNVDEVSVEDIVDYLIKDRLEVIQKKESKRINEIIKYLDSNLNIKYIERDVLINSLNKVIHMQNKIEMFNKFIFYTYYFYSRRSEYFSKKQNEIFYIRYKYRNRIDFSYKDHNFETCYYLKYDKVKPQYMEILKNNKKHLSVADFKSFIELFNKKHIENKIKESIKNIDQFIDKKKDYFIRINPQYKEILNSKSFENELIKTTVKYLSKSPENRRREISEERLNDIFIGEFSEYNSIVQNEILKGMMKIDYKETFQIARKYKRKIKFYIGKTNSGKTYNAFNDLVTFESGCYLAPLRLLAVEGQGEINSRNKICSMLTGEEKNIIDGSKFTSSTIEMLNINNEVDCIVIDEIQMLKDEQRGWAWTQALIGAPAKNIILAGSEEVLDLVKELVKYTGDELEIKRFKRMSPLKIMSKTTKLNDIKSGTAIVTFSRKDVLKYKKLLKDRSISVIYGNLGPEVRLEESQKFRDGDSDILIATDAIAMGLNLPIETILFATHSKCIRGVNHEIDEQLTQQISGRAGRYGIKNIGYVGSLNNKTLKFVNDVMINDIPKYEGKAFIKPNIEYINKIEDVLSINSFKEILEAFGNLFAFDNELFQCSDLGRMIELSEELKDYKLPNGLKLKLSSAPVRESGDDGIYLFNKYVKNVVKNKNLDTYKKILMSSPDIKKYDNIIKTSDSETLKDAEELIHSLDLYSWFSNSFTDSFLDIEGLEIKKKVLNKFILASLNYVKK